MPFPVTPDKENKKLLHWLRFFLVAVGSVPAAPWTMNTNRLRLNRRCTQVAAISWKPLKRYYDADYNVYQILAIFGWILMTITKCIEQQMQETIRLLRVNG